MLLYRSCQLFNSGPVGMKHAMGYLWASTEEQFWSCVLQAHHPSPLLPEFDVLQQQQKLSAPGFLLSTNFASQTLSWASTQLS